MGTGVGAIRCGAAKETLVVCDDECNDLFVECECKSLPRQKARGEAAEKPE